MSTRIAVNGFGRIGRSVTRILAEDTDLELVAVNDPGQGIEHGLHLLKYDTNYGEFEGELGTSGGNLVINGEEVHYLETKDPSELPWGDVGVDVVLECSGVFRTRDKASQHLDAGADRVVISAPPKGDKPVLQIVMGVNHGEYDPEEHRIVSNASCTTNGLAPPTKVLHEEFGIKNALMSTVHSYTNSQVLLDSHNKDWRRARAAAENVVPTTTGAAKATGKVLPELDGKIDGMAYRIPTPTVSVIDLVANLETEASPEDINDAMRAAADGELDGILGVSDEPLVSRDYQGEPLSSVVDAEMTRDVEGGLIKLVAWYDNEWGYSCRTVDLAEYITEGDFSARMAHG